MSIQSSIRRVPLVVVAFLAALLGCAGGSTSTSTQPVQPNAPVISVYDSYAMPFTAYTGTTTYTPVTIVNNADIGVSFAGVTVSNPQFFSVTNTCGTFITYYGTCTASVGFTPPAGTTDYSTIYTATVTVTDGGWQSPQTLAVSARVSAPPEPQAQLAQTSLTFANITPNTSSASVPVSFTNTSTAPLNVSSIVLTGTNASSFVESNNCPTTITQFQYCYITVGMQPTTPSATFNASVVITDNNGGVANSTQTLTLTGTSTAAAPYPQLTLSPATFDFTGTPVGTVPTRIVTLTNSGTAPLTLGALTDTNTFIFPEYGGTCTSTLAAGASCTQTIAFNANTIGAYTGALTFTDNALGSPVSIPIKGTAVEAILSFPSGGPSFSNVAAGTTSAQISVPLENTGNLPVSISSIALATGATTAFTETNNCPATLAVGGECMLTFTFAPGAAARGYGSYVTVSSNATPALLTQSVTGTATGYTSQAKQYIEPDAGFGWLYTLVNSAASTIELTNPEINDATLLTDLVSACSRGVRVRALLAATSSAGYSTLNSSGANCSASAYSGTGSLGESSLVVDDNQIAVMTFPFNTPTYNTARDFAWVNNNPRDVSAVESTFNLDYTHTTPSGYVPDPGEDLLWTPDPVNQLANVISYSQYGVFIEAESITSTAIVNAILKQCQTSQPVILILGPNSSNASLNQFAYYCPGSVYVSDKVHGTLIVSNPTFAAQGVSPSDAYIGSTPLDDGDIQLSRNLGTYPSGVANLEALELLTQTDSAGLPPYQ